MGGCIGTAKRNLLYSRDSTTQFDVLINTYFSFDEGSLQSDILAVIIFNVRVTLI